MWIKSKWNTLCVKNIKMVRKKHSKFRDYYELWQNLKLKSFWSKLLTIFQEVIKEFERNMQDMVGTFVENVQALLSQCRDLENNHHEKMMEIAIVTLEKVIKNELDDEISDDLKMVKYILCAPVWSFFYCHNKSYCPLLF